MAWLSLCRSCRPSARRRRVHGLLAVLVLVVSYALVTRPSTAYAATPITAVAAGGTLALALRSDGQVWAWGYNAWGQLGNGATTDRTTPGLVPGLSDVTAISAGALHALALKSDGTVWAWGNNTFGQIGDSTTTTRLTPVQVSGLSGITAIDAGDYHSLAVKSDGTVWTWGYNQSGQLGDGTTTDRKTPVQVSSLSGITAVSGGHDFSLALKSDGTVRSWGANSMGQLGDGTTTPRLTPVQVVGVYSIASISAGASHALARGPDGGTGIWAWGANFAGQLGDGTRVNRPTPKIVILHHVDFVVAGDHHSAFAYHNYDNSELLAWGRNSWGQLSDGTYVDRLSSVDMGTTVSHRRIKGMAAGPGYTLIVTQYDQVLMAGAYNFSPWTTYSHFQQQAFD